MAEAKQYDLMFSEDEIVRVELVKSVDGYNYITVYVKKRNSYIRINYEWESDVLPDFVMSVAEYLRSNKEMASEKEEELEEFKNRLNSHAD